MAYPPIKNRIKPTLQCNNERCRAKFHHSACKEFKRIDGELVSICPFCKIGTMKTLDQNKKMKKLKRI